MADRAPSLEEHFAAGGPKRILALDGGGIRGILSLGFLLRIEEILRERHGNDPAFRLSHYFDLIAGTSTGSIIAALLAQGESVQEVIQLFWNWRTRCFPVAGGTRAAASCDPATIRINWRTFCANDWGLSALSAIRSTCARACW
jgi:patatin-like phospholipase/acyl hydrolase